jgi:hypothetical protein
MFVPFNVYYTGDASIWRQSIGPVRPLLPAAGEEA